MPYFTLHTYPLQNRTVLVRVDYNVPLKNEKVEDNSRIRASLPTLQCLLEHHCKLVLATHLGKPDGKIVEALRVGPLAKELQRLLGRKVIKLDDCLGPEIKQRIQQGKLGQIFLLENLRFYKEEEQNNPIFAHSLASLADVYVNEAFSASHRAHASIVGIPYFLPAVAGFQLEKEIAYLSKALQPERPAVWIMGGAKLDKIELLRQALQKADLVLIGGALAFPFLRAQGYSVGMSKMSAEAVRIAKNILQTKTAKKLVLPVDVVVADDFSLQATSRTVLAAEIPTTAFGLDLGPQTVQLFKRYLQPARTLVWNGPLGYFEWEKYSKATKEIGRYIVGLPAISIVGGGETAQAMHKFHLDLRLTHVSTGGGAAIEFLMGKKLPGVEALEKNYRRFT
ncbi:MAG: phosphoglycerate kinase [Nanoarchaeota archaeon]